MAKRKPQPLPYLVIEIVSTGCIIKLIKIHEGGMHEFEYVNRKSNRANGGKDKPNLTISNDDINKQLRRETFKNVSDTLTKTDIESPLDGESLLTIV